MPADKLSNSRRLTREDLLREPENPEPAYIDENHYADLPPKIQALVNSPAFRIRNSPTVAAAIQAGAIAIEWHWRLAPYGMRPCPSTFCVRPIIRQGQTGPWPKHCPECKRMLDALRKQKSRQHAKKGEQAETLDWATAAEIEARDAEVAEIDGVMAGNPAHGYKKKKGKRKPLGENAKPVWQAPIEGTLGELWLQGDRDIAVRKANVARRTYYVSCATKTADWRIPSTANPSTCASY
jgi:hypothetical protein